ncbi:hypothetical protein VIGAN_09043000 [Vigna angularis var. angularis]|uniref:Uncharacterized protein n=1 Tax=Vigna angularis var. angularis TaxID=157739 RepID=A0A0S3SW55_PHAAN|nr:hypothetical protein VIGAN_09043000 [Vigna angularis var. angularis]
MDFCKDFKATSHSSRGRGPFKLRAIKAIAIGNPLHSFEILRPLSRILLEELSLKPAYFWNNIHPSFSGKI